jgi:hypothetical protein
VIHDCGAALVIAIIGYPKARGPYLIMVLLLTVVKKDNRSAGQLRPQNPQLRRRQNMGQFDMRKLGARERDNLITGTMIVPRPIL